MLDRTNILGKQWTLKFPICRLLKLLNSTQEPVHLLLHTQNLVDRKSRVVWTVYFCYYNVSSGELSGEVQSTNFHFNNSLTFWLFYSYGIITLNFIMQYLW
jgi:predicted CDP-diglyceride synthetase/phosphatidate cytidylyltransferase